MAALVGLIEVDEVGIDLFGPAARRLKDLAGEDRERHRQRELRGVLPARDGGVMLWKFSQDSRAAEVAVFVSQ